MKSLVDLAVDLLIDLGRRSGVRVDRDVQTLRTRCKHEGEGFLTLTLPTFAKGLERSLDESRVRPDLWASFGKLRAGIPHFLKGFLSHVFSPDGVLRTDARADCILAVRQLCLAFKKLRGPCSQARCLDVVREYRECENEIGDIPDKDVYLTWFQAVARVIVPHLELVDDVINDVAEKRGHGPGSTFEHATPNGKWRFQTWHSRLNSVGLTYVKFGRGSIVQWLFTESGITGWPRNLSPEQEPPTRVVLVPKTPKAPRVIAVEPVVMQFTQQIIANALKRRVRTCRFTTGHVCFDDQTVNQRLAELGSKGGNYATLDLKEASDRVSVALVERMFAAAPRLKELLLATRSTRVRLPDGDELPLKKFASMGSSTCFPVEAVTFFIAVIASRLVRQGRFPSERAVWHASRDVYVYGDDLVVPADEAPGICVDLARFGLRVNLQKSFWTGRFRESCGEDYWNGHRVTPVYVRERCPAGPADASRVLSWVATANQLYEAGLTRAATAMREAVERSMGERLPEVGPRDSAVGWRWYSDYRPPSRWNKALQRTEYRCRVPESPMFDDPLEGDAALAKCFRHIKGGFKTLLDGEPSCVERHLEESVTPYAVALKRRWVTLNN